MKAQARRLPSPTGFHVALLWWLLLPAAFASRTAAVLDRQYGDWEALAVGLPLLRMELPLAGGRVQFELRGLKARHGYEVKISFPGTVPATYHIELVGDGVEGALPGRRRLLNTEKLVFVTNKQGRPLSGSVVMQAAILVTVQPLGWVVGHRIPPATAIFNIELDELRLGLPQRSWWVAALALLSLAAVVFTLSLLPGKWLTGGSPTQVPKTQ